MNDQNKLIKIIDRSILVFVILFLLSLSNSIFVNQLGYYGALLLILFRYFLTKENQFKKTGLELALVWYLAAEILSAIFTQYHSNANTNLLKRALLIPIIYTFIAASTDLKRAKLYLKIYIGASLITVLIYLFFSYRFYIENLYGVEQSGPSVFQYPITASEIISFSVIFLFAFLINEKVSIKNRLLLLIGFGLSALALVSTYKRTGWLGAAFGIFIILLIKRQWKILIPLVVLGLIVVLTQKNISEVFIFNYSNSTIIKSVELKTDGRAYSVYPEKNKYFVSDYEDGIVEYQDSTIINRIKTPAPVYELRKWTDDYLLAYLSDTRFLLIKKNDDEFKIQKEFLTPGFTTSFRINNGYLYILDSDSGLTVYRDPNNFDNYMRFEKFTGFTNFYTDSSYFVFQSPGNGVTIYKSDYNLPGDSLYSYKNSNIDFLYYINSKLFVSDNTGLKLFKVAAHNLVPLDKTKKIIKALYWEQKDDKLFTADLSNKVFELGFPVSDSINIKSVNQLTFTPSSISYNNNKLYFTYLKRSRLLSIWDPYLPSNYTRFALWRAGWKMFKDHPLFGVGDIDLREYYIKYKRPFDKEIQGHMHNNFVHVLVTLGAFGFLAVIFLFLKIVIIEWKVYKERINLPFVASYALGALGCFAAFLFSGLTEMNFGDHEIITLVWFTFGLNMAFYFLSQNMVDYNQ